ncbi:MAG: NADH-quinone oxidoreductase subunit NuoN [Gammaproteobacteria bacterium]|nr:NADH-quinone oxidoreductase subunit NuoN [Gammaproteobacteria bacterium]MDH5594733.1 NADH-quinone oxidoreductase subunit NuoN [Gammaproteobacteria bacterium]MDH5613594.1 NADH-quinone oxidoreductase subunit NuoN [Gammaproteobacteria bacterium]
MNFDYTQLIPLLPEITVLTMACLVLVVDVYKTSKDSNLTYYLTQLTLVMAAILTIALPATETNRVFNGMFVADSMSDLLKLFIYIVSFMVFVYSREYLRAREMYRGEYFVLGLFGILGMMIMVSAHNLLMVYLGLELLSLCLYAMVAMQRNVVTVSEAAMKYFVLGALASGMLLYGMSLLYGATGTLDIVEMSNKLSTGDLSSSLIMITGMVFLITGLGFKLGAVPFHMWVPDVYHGAPTSVTLYIGAAPKIAAFALVMRLLVEGLGSMQAQWQDILIIMTVLSLFVGNVIAIAQTNIKRMLAYSTISHVAYLLLGIIAGTQSGYVASMFYVIVYAIMSMAAFGMILFLSRAGFEADSLDDLKGLNERSPWYAFMMLIVMFSMAGVPPLLGFWAKLAVLKAVVEVDLVWLAVTAVAFSIIGAFYYLRVVKLMYFDKAEDTNDFIAGPDMRFFLSANALAILGLGIFPGGLLSLCASALGM